MTIEPLPHGYPFRFVDRTLERTGPTSGRVRALVSAGGRGASGGALGGALIGELMAQAALLLGGGDPEAGRTGFLGGFSGLSVRRPVLPGEALVVDVAVSKRLGPAVRFDATAFGEAGDVVATGSFTVRKGETGPGGSR